MPKAPNSLRDSSDKSGAVESKWMVSGEIDALVRKWMAPICVLPLLGHLVTWDRFPLDFWSVHANVPVPSLPSLEAKLTH